MEESLEEFGLGVEDLPLSASILMSSEMLLISIGLDIDRKKGNWFVFAISLIGTLSGVVHTGVEVCRMDSEMSRLVERPWLRLMCCAVCLLHGRNFR